MEQENYYQVNLETGKLNIHTSKQFYTGLDQASKKVFKYCLFSRSQDCWVSKGKAENCWHVIEGLKKLGFIQKDPIGEKISFQEQVNREQERANYRLESAEARAERAKKNAERFSITAIKMNSVIPTGQRILVGHHSESADRRYRGRIENYMRKSVEESNKAEYYFKKTESAKYTANGQKFKNERYLSRRIKESESIIRVNERKISGKYLPGSPIVPISDQLKAVYEKANAEQREKLDFYYKCMKEIKPDWQPSQKNSRKKGNGI